jgi:hypothetical protein
VNSYPQFTSSEIFAFLDHKRATDDDLELSILYLEKAIRRFVPEAKLLFACDSRGVVIEAGIYDVQLLLNRRGQFKPIQQNAPQLLSKKVQWKDNHFYSLKLKLTFDLWLSSVPNVVARYPELSKIIHPPALPK